MGKKYFCTSDIHGFFDIFHEALIKAGFEENNPDHVLIICGDIFDRGKEPLEVYNFLKSLPQERRILVRGNHELLLQELVDREEALSHDLHNGTYQTLYSFLGYDYETERKKEVFDWVHAPAYGAPGHDEFFEKYNAKRQKFQHRLFHNRKLNEILKWINSDEWVSYYELGPYIFIHAALPLTINHDNWGQLEISPEWRKQQWDEAVWKCPYRFYMEHKDSPELKGRILVVGHWHTSDFWNNLEHKNFDVYEFNPIFISKNYPGLIGLDACTAATKGCNILVINEDMNLEPHNHRDYIIETVTEEK